MNFQVIYFLQRLFSSGGVLIVWGISLVCYVLLALGLTHEVAHGSVRMTLGDDTTDEDIDYVLETLPKVAHRLRSMSPISPID